MSDDCTRQLCASLADRFRSERDFKHDRDVAIKVLKPDLS